MDVANEILDAIEIIVDKKIRENTAQIYFGVCKSVSGDSCVMSINGKNNTIHFYGSAPIVGLTYRVFVPNGNMSMAFAITGNDDRKGLYYSNPNLLDNWYFGNPVNQRGKTEYNGNNIYTIDRWLLTQATGALQVEQGQITFSANTATIQLRQYIETSLPDGYYTLSVLLADNSLYHKVLKKTGNTYASVSSGGSLGVSGAGAGMQVTSANSGDTLFIYTPINTSISLKAVKLELGSTQTLAHQDGDRNWVLNEIPDYGEQLRRCQRYFVNFNPSKVNWFAMPPAVASNTTEAYSSVTLPVAMRAQPTVSYGGKIALSQTDDVQVTGIQVSGSTFAGNYLQLKYSVADGLTANSTYRVQGYNDPTSYIWLSADL